MYNLYVVPGKLNTINTIYRHTKMKSPKVHFIIKNIFYGK